MPNMDPFGPLFWVVGGGYPISPHLLLYFGRICTECVEGVKSVISVLQTPTRYDVVHSSPTSLNFEILNIFLPSIFRISILNKDRKKVWGEEMAAYTAHALNFSTIKEKKRNVMGYAQFIGRDTLFKHKDIFLSGGNLSLGT